MVLTSSAKSAFLSGKWYITADWLRPISSAIIWKLASAKPCLAERRMAVRIIFCLVLSPFLVSGLAFIGEFYLIY